MASKAPVVQTSLGKGPEKDAAVAKAKARDQAVISKEGLISALFSNFTSHKNRTGERTAVMKIRMLLDSKVANELPDAIRKGYKQMQDAGLRRSDLDAERVRAQDVKVASFPAEDGGQPAGSRITVRSARLRNISLREVKSKNDVSYWLWFDLPVDLGGGNAEWLCQNFDNKVWISMDVAQKEFSEAA